MAKRSIKKEERQYEQERKRRASRDMNTSSKSKKSKKDEEAPVPAVFPAPRIEAPELQDTLPDLTHEQDEDFPTVDIDA